MLYEDKLRRILEQQNESRENRVAKNPLDGDDDSVDSSDDDITKEVYQRYRTFVAPEVEITPANYAEKLSKIDLPYFRELIDLVSLEKLCILYETNQPSDKVKANTKTETNIASGGDTGKDENVDIPEEAESGEQTKSAQPKRHPKKRTYEPKLNSKQYVLLSECVEEIKLFRCKVKITELKKLLKGKLTEPLEVTNQKSLVYQIGRASCRERV